MKDFFLILSAFVLGVLLCFFVMTNVSKKLLRQATAADLAETIAVMKQLREHPLSHGLELLENNVDRKIATIDNMASDLNAISSNAEISALRLAKGYRKKYPYTNDNAQIQSTVESMLNSIGRID